LEDGSSAPAAILKAISQREATIAQLEREGIAAGNENPRRHIGDISKWVKTQLADLTGLLKSDPLRVKAEFRKLDLHLTFDPTEAEPRPYYVVKGQCDLSALVFSFERPTAVLTSVRHWSEPRIQSIYRGSGAVLDLMLASQGPARNWSRARFTS
jgi:hypothetical protein